MDNKQIEVRAIVSPMAVEKREDGSSSRKISGYGAVFDSWSSPIYDWFVEKIDRNAFKDCDFSDCILAFNHNGIVARYSSGTLELEVDEKGLRFEAELPNTTLGNDMLELISRGDITQCSFRFIVESDAWKYADKDNGMEYDERTILSISKCYDVSPVIYPAYPDTEVDIARSLAGSDREKEFRLMRQGTPDAAAASADRDRQVEFLRLRR